MKKFFTFVAAAMMVVGVNAQTTDQYIFEQNESLSAGQEISGNNSIVTMTMPKYDKNGNDATMKNVAKSTTNWADKDFGYYTEGNGANPALKDGVVCGTAYTFTSTKAGLLTVAVCLNASKALGIYVDNATATFTDYLESYNLPSEKGGDSQTLDADNKVSTKSYGTITISIEAGKSYSVFCSGSKLGLYGFKFQASEEPTTKEITAAYEYTTHCYSEELNFTDTGLTPYYVSAISSTEATITEFTDGIVPAEVGFILKNSDTSTTTFAVPVSATSASLSATNYLNGVLTDTSLEADAAYILSDGKFVPAAAGTLPANKSYLKASDLTGGSAKLNIVFDDATGINQVKGAANSGEIYNLQGVEVNDPATGLYIKNGKKYIVK